MEEGRKSLAKREAHATGIDKELGRQRDSLKKLKERAEQREAELEERSRELEGRSREVEVAKEPWTPRCRRRSGRRSGSTRRTSAWRPSGSLTGRPKRAWHWCHLD